MKSLNNCFSKLSVLILISSFIFGSCGKIDDTYREFLEGGATVYVAKADSLKIRPGRERVELQWLVMSDPKVKKYKVFWNNKADSIEQDLNREVNGDTVRLVIDNLAGGVYEFEVFQYSSDNKSSVRAAVIGRVYDSGYEAYLPNRSVEFAETDANGMTTIRWNKYNNVDMLGIELSYTNTSDINTKSIVPPEETVTVLNDLKSLSEITFRTMYKPDSLAIDTFYSVLSTFRPQEDVTALYLKNYKMPFERLTDWDGSRWGIVADWIVNDGAKIHSCKDGKCYGSWDGHASFRQNSMSVQTSTREPQALNGKIYQTIYLPKGEYELTLAGVAAAGVGGNDARYLVVTADTELPDIDQLDNAIAHRSFVANKLVSITFDLDEDMEVSMGILFHFLNTSQSFNIESFKLIRK